MRIAAAADLTEVSDELRRAFDSQGAGSSLEFSFGSSGSLAQQIRHGAPFDVFLSANAQFVDDLGRSGEIDPHSVYPYAVGRLALVWRDGQRHSIADLKSAKAVGIANPALAPYGLAAEQVLRHLNLWDSLHSRLAYAENVRQTLQMVDSGNADAVLTSAALVRNRPHTQVNSSWHDPIVQKAGIVAATDRRALAERFMHFLRSAPGQQVLARWGFQSPPENKPKGN